MKKKIAIVITRLIPGGAAQVVKNIIDYGKEEFDFTLFTGAGGISEEEKKQLNAKYKIFFVNQLVRQISPLKDYYAYYVMRREFLRSNFAIVHTHTSKAGFLGRLAAKNAGIKKIIHSTHGSIYLPGSRIPGVPDLSIYKKMFLRTEKMLAPWTDWHIVLSNTEYDFSIKTGLSREDNTIVIPNGIVLEDFSFTQDQKKSIKKTLFPEWCDTSKIILCVGRLSSEKGQGILIDAFISLIKEHGYTNLKLVIVGDGPDRTALEKKSSPYLESRDIIFCGYQHDPRKYYAAADIYVQPSFYEGFGLSLIEAMATGLPCIASNVGGMSEIIKGFDNGLFFQRGDVDQLKERIRLLLNSTDLSTKISQNAKSSVKKFELRTILNNYYKLYREN